MQRILVAHEKRFEPEKYAAARMAARDEGTEMGRQIKRARRLGNMALYCRAAKYLTHSPKFDPATSSMLARMK